MELCRDGEQVCGAVCPALVRTVKKEKWACRAGVLPGGARAAQQRPEHSGACRCVSPHLRASLVLFLWLFSCLVLLPYSDLFLFTYFIVP